MSFEIEGKIHMIGETENKTDTFQVRDLVIETDGVYPQFIKFQMTQDRCGIVDGYSEAEKIKVYFDLRGREWNGKYFTNLNAWKIERVSDTASAGQAGPGDEPPGNSFDDFPTEEPKNLENDLDDLPF